VLEREENGRGERSLTECSAASRGDVGAYDGSASAGGEQEGRREGGQHRGMG
jgi:hypothetical protein